MKQRLDFVEFVKILGDSQDGSNIIKNKKIAIDLTRLFVEACIEISEEETNKVFSREVSESDNAITGTTANGIMQRNDNLASKYKEFASKWPLELFMKKLESTFAFFISDFDVKYLVERLTKVIEEDKNFRDTKRKKVFSYLDDEEEYTNFLIAVFIDVIKYGSEVKKEKKSKKKCLDQKNTSTTHIKEIPTTVNINNFYSDSKKNFVERQIIETIMHESLFLPSSEDFNDGVFQYFNKTGQFSFYLLTKSKNTKLPKFDFKELLNLKEKKQLPVAISEKYITEISLIRKNFFAEMNEKVDKSFVDLKFSNSKTPAAFVSILLESQIVDFEDKASSIVNFLMDKNINVKGKDMILVLKSASTSSLVQYEQTIVNILEKNNLKQVVIEKNIDRTLDDLTVLYILITDKFLATNNPEAKQVNFTLNKQVRKRGEKEWKKTIEANANDEVDFLISYRNTGEVSNKDVIVKDILPNSLLYINDSTRVANASNPKGIAITSNKLIENGINIGNYSPDSNAFITYSAKVLECNNTDILTSETYLSTSYGSKVNDAKLIIKQK